MNNSVTIVFTTIYDPVILGEYYDNLSKFGHLDQVNFIVIPDKKTPAKAWETCKKYANKGLKIDFPSLEEQVTFLKKINFDPELIPYNSDNRRNVGYLMAMEGGADVIISIDDDNYCLSNEDFVGGHLVVAEEEHEFDALESDTGWYNICNMLEKLPDRPTYPRGFPYYARHKEETNSQIHSKGVIHINAGLWLQDPDVDGISWLVNPVKITALNTKEVVLGDKTWSPINTQNTALRREVMASYYFLKMKYPLAGIEIDRYGDIFSGYLSQACVRAVGGYVRFGTPMVNHIRNSHNYLNDAFNELACVMVLEDLLQWLTTDYQFTESNYVDAYISLSSALQDQVEKFEGKIWTDGTRGYFHQMAHYMRQWAKTSKNLL